MEAAGIPAWGHRLLEEIQQQSEAEKTRSVFVLKWIAAQVELQQALADLQHLASSSTQQPRIAAVQSELEEASPDEHWGRSSPLRSAL